MKYLIVYKNFKNKKSIDRKASWYKYDREYLETGVLKGL